MTKPILAAVLLSLIGLVCPAVAQEAPPRTQWKQPQWDQLAPGASYPTARINVPGWRRTDSPHVRTAFRGVIADARPAIVRVRSEGRDIALGGIVDPDGWILTKASRLTQDVICRLGDKRELVAEVVGTHRDYDLALLKIAASDLPALQLKSTTDEPAVGAWLATVGMNRGPLAVGVVSVESRAIPHRPGILGLRFDSQRERAVIETVFPNTAAEKAGLQAADELLSVDGLQTSTREALVQLIRKHSPGDRVELKIRRGDQTQTIAATLQGKRPWRLPSREDFQNGLGSQLSRRRFGFPTAFQHDTVVKPSDCGGPVVNLDGEVVGFNIARAGRTETFAIPAAVLVELVEKLKLAATRSSASGG